MRMLGVDLKELAQRGSSFDIDDLRTRCHQVADLPVTEPKDSFQHLSFFPFDHTLRAGDVDQHSQLAFGYRRGDQPACAT